MSEVPTEIGSEQMMDLFRQVGKCTVKTHRDNLYTVGYRHLSVSETFVNWYDVQTLEGFPVSPLVAGLEMIVDVSPDGWFVFVYSLF